MIILLAVFGRIEKDVGDIVAHVYTIVWMG